MNGRAVKVAKFEEVFGGLSGIFFFFFLKDEPLLSFELNTRLLYTFLAIWLKEVQEEGYSAVRGSLLSTFVLNGNW